MDSIVSHIGSKVVRSSIRADVTVLESGAMQTYER
ncbi:hypothetical protein LCGC14_2314020 [marine sediment metagenome]|uniref:Uncharacterized protein n=1 Tax=marine sediment metagenome TaxID=412755 RepID=A0A0F9CKC1_9ZZZZ